MVSEPVQNIIVMEEMEKLASTRLSTHYYYIWSVPILCINRLYALQRLTGGDSSLHSLVNSPQIALEPVSDHSNFKIFLGGRKYWWPISELMGPYPASFYFLFIARAYVHPIYDYDIHFRSQQANEDTIYNFKHSQYIIHGVLVEQGVCGMSPYQLECMQLLK